MTVYNFSHIIQCFILPPGINIVLMVVGVLSFLYSRVIGIILIALSVITLCLLSTPVIAQQLINILQNQYPRLRINGETSRHQAAMIVLGGGDEISPAFHDGYQLSSATEFRLRYAVFLYHKTHMPIIVSGGTLYKSSPSGAELMQKELKNYFHIFASWEETRSLDTKDEAKYLMPILEKYKIKTAYLITNAFHMPRAMYAFNSAAYHENIKFIAAPMGYSMNQPNQGIFNYLPSIDALENSNTALHEFFGIIYYHFCYGK